MAISKGLLLKVIGGLAGTAGVTGGSIVLGNQVWKGQAGSGQGSKNAVPGDAGGLPGGSGEKSATDPAPIQASTPQGEAGTTGTGSGPVVTNTVDTGSRSGLQKPKESQIETQSPSSTTTHDSGISSQPQLQQPQLQQQVQEATEKTSTGGEGSGGASQDSTDDVSKTNLGQGGGDTTEGTNSQTKDTDTSDSVGKQGDKVTKVEGADAGSKGLKGSNGDNGDGGAGGANTADGSLGGSDSVTGGQKDGGSADPAASTNQLPEQGAGGGQTLQSGESAGGPQTTPSVDPLPTSTTGESKPGGAGQGAQMQDGAVNQASQPQAQGNASTGQEGAAGGGQGVSDPIVSSTGESPTPSTDDNQHNSKQNEAGEGDNNKASKGLDTKTPTNELKEGETVTTGTEPGADTNVKTQTGDQTLPSSDLPGSSDTQIQSPDISTSDRTGTPDGNQDKSQVQGGGAASLPKVEGQGVGQQGAGLTDQVSEIAGNSNTDGSNQGGGSDLGQISGASSTPTLEGGEKGLDSGGAVNAKDVKGTQEGQQGTSQPDLTKTQGSEGKVLTTESTTTSTTTSEGVEAPTVGSGSSSEKATTTSTGSDSTTTPAGTTGQGAVTDVLNVDKISFPPVI